jgi:hypothetical protein
MRLVVFTSFFYLFVKKIKINFLLASMKSLINCENPSIILFRTLVWLYDSRLYSKSSSKSQSLMVPKCEIFESSDFHYFYTISLSGLVTLVLKYKLVTFNFEGARHHLVFGVQAEHTCKELMRTLSMRISSLRACSVHANDQHGLKALFKFGIFMLMRSICVRS